SNAKMLDRPHFAGPVHAHLDLVDDEQNAVLVEHFFQPGEEIHRRNDIAARSLQRLDIEGGVFRFARFRIPHAMIFGFEEARELLDAVAPVFLLAHPFRPAKMIGERDELRTVAEMSVAAAITVARCNRRSTERAPMISALEGEHQTLAARCIAHELQAVLDSLATADIEMNAALLAELRFHIARDVRGKLDLRAVQ